MARNPSLIQHAAAWESSVPLILIHDGGGSTFSYYLLPSLQRTVYAIHNPRLFSGRPWAGGIPAMARAYLDLIRMALPSGKVFLGGKSNPHEV